MDIKQKSLFLFLSYKTAFQSNIENVNKPLLFWCILVFVLQVLHLWLRKRTFQLLHPWCPVHLRRKNKLLLLAKNLWWEAGFGFFKILARINGSSLCKSLRNVKLVKIPFCKIPKYRIKGTYSRCLNIRCKKI